MLILKRSDMTTIREVSVFNVPFGEWEKIPRLQAKTLVGLRYYAELPQDLAFRL